MRDLKHQTVIIFCTTRFSTSNASKTNLVFGSSIAASLDGRKTEKKSPGNYPLPGTGSKIIFYVLLTCVCVYKYVYV